MLTDLQTFLLSLAAVVGALFSAAAGWLDSGEPFVARKFTSSILRAFIAGVLFAASTFAGLDTIASGWVYLFAFLGGAGIDVLGNRGAGAIVAAIKTANAATGPTGSPPPKLTILKRVYYILISNLKKRLMFLAYRK